MSGLLAVRSHRRRSQPVGDSKLLELVDVLRAELRCRRRVEIRESDLLVTASPDPLAGGMDPLEQTETANRAGSRDRPHLPE